MKIEQLNKNNTEYINIVINRVISHWNMNYNDAHNEVYRWINNIGNSICYIGVMYDELIATAGFETKNDDVEYKADAWFTFLWVDEKYRGKGYGWLLSEKRIEYAKSLGFKKVHLDTVQAREYHLKFGWKDVEQTIYDYKTDYIMSLDIKN